MLEDPGQAISDEDVADAQELMRYLLSFGAAEIDGQTQLVDVELVVKVAGIDRRDARRSDLPAADTLGNLTFRFEQDRLGAVVRQQFGACRAGGQRGEVNDSYSTQWLETLRHVTTPRACNDSSSPVDSPSMPQNTSALCSPSRGARRCSRQGVSDSTYGPPGIAD